MDYKENLHMMDNDEAEAYVTNYPYDMLAGKSRFF